MRCFDIKNRGRRAVRIAAFRPPASVIYFGGSATLSSIFTLSSHRSNTYRLGVDSDECNRGAKECKLSAKKCKCTPFAIDAHRLALPRLFDACGVMRSFSVDSDVVKRRESQNLTTSLQHRFYKCPVLRYTKVGPKGDALIEMAKRKFSAPPKEVASLFSLEWRRAKHILSPMLDHKRMPKLYMATGLSGAIGWHFGRKGMYAGKLHGMKRYVRAEHIIALKQDRPLDEMKHTMRHEITHCVHQDHSPKFHNLLRGLERGREIEDALGIKE